MNHKLNGRTDKGFTLIELLLAMTFISVLLLAIAMTIVQIANIYNRGMVTKELNQVSRSIDVELTASLRSGGSFSLDASANRYVSKAWGGRLCLGQYSYIWNYGKALEYGDSSRNQYTTASAGNIRFVKVPDSGGSYCVPTDSGGYSKIDPTGATELLMEGDHDLVVHALSVVSTSTARDELSNQQLYKFTYTIGTSKIGALNSNQTACKAPNVPGSDLNYCSVQQFGLVLRVVSGVN